MKPTAGGAQPALPGLNNTQNNKNTTHNKYSTKIDPAINFLSARDGEPDRGTLSVVTENRRHVDPAGGCSRVCAFSKLSSPSPDLCPAFTEPYLERGRACAERTERP